MKKAWVIGEGGLLGAHLRAQLETQPGVQIFTPSAAFSWGNNEIVLQQFQVAIDAFAKTVAVEDEWLIFWAAGRGTMHSAEQELLEETQIFKHFIHMIVHSSLNLAKGLFHFASSAGAVYAGSQNSIITEKTLTHPINPYGVAKLEQESFLKNMVQQNPLLNVLVTRISTLYGNRIKQNDIQGLLAKISRQVVRNQPIHIYVPLGTMRDYLHAGDAARTIASTAEYLQGKRGGFYIKLVASERACTIAEIISIFKRAAHRNIRVIHYALPSSAFYVKNIQYRSISFKNILSLPPRNLLIGISQLLENDRYLSKSS